MTAETEMTAEQAAQIQADIVAMTRRLQEVSQGGDVGTVMSALLSCVMSGAAGTPTARSAISAHLRGAAHAVEAMGDLFGDEALRAAAGATEAVFLTNEPDAALPPGHRLQ